LKALLKEIIDLNRSILTILARQESIMEAWTEDKPMSKIDWKLLEKELKERSLYTMDTTIRKTKRREC